LLVSPSTSSGTTCRTMVGELVEPQHVTLN